MASIQEYEEQIERLEKGVVTPGELERFAVVVGDPAKEHVLIAAANALAEVSRELRRKLWSPSYRNLATALIKRADSAAMSIGPFPIERLPRFNEVHSGGTVTAAAVY